MSEPILEFRDVSKHFGGVTALDHVDFTLYRGEVHSIVGENGAGKSTLIKIISGVHTDYEGEMFFEGKPVRFHSPADAKSRGIGTVYQELSVAPHLSVAENLFMGNLPVNRFKLVDWKHINQKAREYLLELGLDVDVRRPLGLFPIGVQQMVEVARVLFSGARVIIMDEPTSALSPPEAQRLFQFIANLKARGATIIYISHFLEESLAVSDRITVMKNGRRVGTYASQDVDKAFLIRQMIGEESGSLFAAYVSAEDRCCDRAGEVIFQVKGLSKGRDFHDISFDVRSGEIVGLYGFMGAGKTALANTLFGYEKPDAGEILLQGRPLHLKNTESARRQGMAYVPNNRRLSIFPGKEVYKNVTVTYLDQILGHVLRKKIELSVTQKLIQRTGVQPPDPQKEIQHLSGGNQQKAILAKWLVKAPVFLILNEPTRGMDVGAKEEVMQIVRELRDQGMAILLISSEPEIILANSDRILVMSQGRLTHTTENRGQTKESIMQWA